jgi:hypothetical protein
MPQLQSRNPRLELEPPPRLLPGPTLAAKADTTPTCHHHRPSGKGSPAGGPSLKRVTPRKRCLKRHGNKRRGDLAHPGIREETSRPLRDATRNPGLAVVIGRGIRDRHDALHAPGPEANLGGEANLKRNAAASHGLHIAAGPRTLLAHRQKAPPLSASLTGSFIQITPLQNTTKWEKGMAKVWRANKDPTGPGSRSSLRLGPLGHPAQAMSTRMAMVRASRHPELPVKCRCRTHKRKRNWCNSTPAPNHHKALPGILQQNPASSRPPIFQRERSCRNAASRGETPNADASEAP